MNPLERYCALQNRRQFLTHSSMGLGGIAFANAVPALAGDSTPHHTPKAKRVIFLSMAGGPSQLDLFDYKPDLHKQHGKPLPKSVTMGQRVTIMTKGRAKITYASPFKFSKHGQSGLYLSELLPYLSTMIDDLCLIKSTNTNAINHDPAQTFLCTGSEIAGKPSMGAWLSYGLGSMNRDLPDFVVLTSAFFSGKVNVQALYSRLWSSSFLPSHHQGVSFQSNDDPVLFLSNPPGINRAVRRRSLDLVTQLNRKHQVLAGDPEIETSINQQEMAFRMQASVPELTDLSKESKQVMESYGPDVHKSGSFARNCLLARRMAERNVRFIQLFHRGWDHHAQLPVNLRAQCRDVDQPITALLRDLKQRGLFDDTLVVFAGEFGRTTYGQAAQNQANFGRDHHPRCFTTWMAGGGIKGGFSYGETDEYSYNITKQPVAVRDFHATILHQLGLNHTRLTFLFQGLGQKLTGVKSARVVKEILA